MSQGIPALTIGSGEGGGTHSEWHKPIDTHFGPSVAADSEVSLVAPTEPPAAAAIIRRVFEPSAAGGDLSTRGNPQEAVMTHWHDSMVDRPQTDGGVYVAGWTISGLAVLGTIVAVWILGI